MGLSVEGGRCTTYEMSQAVQHTATTEGANKRKRREGRGRALEREKDEEDSLAT